MIYTFDNSLKEIAEVHNKFYAVKALLSILAVIGAVIVNVLSYVNFKDSN